MKKLWSYCKYIVGLSYFLLTIYGFLPVRIPNPFQAYDKPNVLLISLQDCTACADCVVEKGKLVIPPEIALNYPKLKTNVLEINLVNAEGINKLWDENTKFVVTGYVIGIDTGEYDPPLPPKFYVQSWTTTNYCARFWGMSRPLGILWIINLIFVLPFVILLTISWKKKKA